MAARLGVGLVAFAAALVVIGAGREGAEVAEWGLYGTLAFSFLCTAVYAGCFGRVRRFDRFGAVQLSTDVLVVSALVFFTGGGVSIFSFLFLPVTVCGSLLFSRRGAYIGAGLSSLGYGVAILAAEQAGLREVFTPGPLHVPLLYPWAVHTGALLLVALLSGVLTRELALAGEALHRSRRDLGALRELHQRTVESLTSGLLTTDARGRITSLNSEGERITGRSRDALRGSDLATVLPELTLDDAVPDEPGRADQVRARVVFHDGEGRELYLGVARSTLRGDHGRPEGTVLIFQDVTEIVAMERDLRRNERLAAAGQLSASMAHEIRNPLAAISGSIEILRSGPADSGERDRLMEIVLREIERLDGLIDDFLRYARPDAPRITSVPLRDVIERVGDLFEAERPAGIGLEVDAPEGLYAVGDHDQLLQVVWNLVRNAVAALDGGGRLEIRVRHLSEEPQEPEGEGRNDAKEGPGWVEIAVTDTGIGIPADVLEHVFDPFFTTRPGGTGLGLATVHRIVEAHGGITRVESREGVGTTVCVRLPGGGEGAAP